MSDFTSDFWHLYVAGLTFISIIACLILLWISGTTKVKASDDNTTGHVWDEDLREMNNPLPRWWVYLFIITVIFGLVYGALYPMFGKVGGQLGWSAVGQYEAEKQRNLDAIAPLYAAFSEMEPEKLAGDPAAMAIGERLYMNYCAQCHGDSRRKHRQDEGILEGPPCHVQVEDICVMPKGKVGKHYRRSPVFENRGQKHRAHRDYAGEQ